MHKKIFGYIIEDEYQGKTVRVVTSWGNVAYLQIEYYANDQGGVVLKV